MKEWRRSNAIAIEKRENEKENKGGEGGEIEIEQETGKNKGSEGKLCWVGLEKGGGDALFFLGPFYILSPSHPTLR